MLGKLDIHMKKRLNPYPLPYAKKINFRCVSVLMEKNRKLCGTGTVSGFLDIVPKAQEKTIETRQKACKGVFLRVRTCAQKTLAKKRNHNY